MIALASNLCLPIHRDGEGREEPLEMSVNDGIMNALGEIARGR
jgi:hypothetical protein